MSRVFEELLDETRADEKYANMARGGGEDLALTSMGREFLGMGEDGSAASIFRPSTEVSEGEQTQELQRAVAHNAADDYKEYFIQRSGMFGEGVDTERMGNNMATILSKLDERESLLRGADSAAVSTEGAIKLGMLSKKCEILLNLPPDDLTSLLESFGNDAAGKEKLKQFIKESGKRDFEIITQLGKDTDKGKVSLSEFSTYRDSVGSSWKDRDLLNKTNNILSKTGRGDNLKPFTDLKDTVEGGGYEGFFGGRRFLSRGGNNITEDGLGKLNKKIEDCEKIKENPKIANKKVLEDPKSKFGKFLKDASEGKDINYEEYLKDLNAKQLEKFDKDMKLTDGLLSFSKRIALGGFLIATAAVGIYSYGHSQSSPKDATQSKRPLDDGNPAKPFLTCASRPPPNNPLTTYELGYVCGLEQSATHWAKDTTFNCPSPNKDTTFTITPADDCEKCVENGMIEEPEKYHLYDLGKWEGDKSIAEKVCKDIINDVDDAEGGYRSLIAYIKLYTGVILGGLIIMSLVLLVTVCSILSQFLRNMIRELRWYIISFYVLSAGWIYFFAGKLNTSYNKFKNTNLTGKMINIFNRYNKASDKDIISQAEIKEYIAEIDNKFTVNPESTTGERDRDLGSFVVNCVSLVDNDTIPFYTPAFFFACLLILLIINIITIALTFKKDDMVRSDITEMNEKFSSARESAATKIQDRISSVKEYGKRKDDNSDSSSESNPTFKEGKGVHIDINFDDDTTRMGKQGGGGIKDISKKIKPKILNKFNRWLIIILLVFAILINHFYNKNRSRLENKNYIREIKRTQREKNKKIVTKEKEINKHNLSDTVFGGYFI